MTENKDLPADPFEELMERNKHLKWPIIIIIIVIIMLIILIDLSTPNG